MAIRTIPSWMAALLVLGGCAGGDPVSDAGFPEAAMERLASDARALQIEVRSSPSQPPSRGEASFELRVVDGAGGAVDGLSLEVTPWMPSMNHGSSVKPQVSPQGDGRYLVTGVSLFMPGRWELRTRITGAAQDSCTVAFDVP